MKLKNSYILLIAMAIFLLVSIGSVCASDTAMDADSQLANDGSNVVLANDTSSDSSDNNAKVATTVVSEDKTINENESAKIPVTVKDSDSHDINITAGDLNVTENEKALKFNYTNSSIVLTDELATGNHSLLITYLGNANYTNSSTKVLLSIIGQKDLNVSSTINVNSTKKAVIPLTITDGVNVYDIIKENLTAVISYTENNETINKTIAFEYVNDTIKFDYDLNATTCSLNVTYTEGNKTYSKKITLNRIYNAKIEILNNENEYQTGYFKFKVVDTDTNEPISGRTLSLYIVSSTISAGFSATTDDEGIASFKTSSLYEFDNTDNSFAMKLLEVGNHTIRLSMASPIIATTVNSNLVITPANINIVINPFKEYYGTTKQVVINVTNANTGEAMSGIILHLYMANTTAKDYYFQTDSNGTSKINVSGLVSGVYQVTVSNNDTNNINNKSVDGSITILAKPAKITVSVPSTYYYNTGNIATIKVTDKSTGKAIAGAIVLVQIYTGKTSQAYLYQANNKGIINVNYAPSAVGSHKIVVTLADTRYSGSAVTKTVKVKKATAKITSKKVTAYYKGGKNLIITLKNTKNNKAIYAAKLNLKIFISSNRYYNYNGQTGLDGKLRISLDTFKPGTYKVVISKGESKNFTVSKKTTQFVIKKAPAKLIPTKLTAKKGTSTKFKVTVKNKKTNKVIKSVKVKIKVYTGKSTKTYTVSTNSKGIAQLNVKSLSVGTHKVVVTSGNSYVTAKSATSSIKITK